MTPEAEAIIHAWWDEGNGWERGVTAGVLADKLEDGEGPVDPLLLSWLRCQTGGDGEEARASAYVGLLCDIGGVFHISGGTTANPTLRQCLHELCIKMRQRYNPTWNDIANTGQAVTGPEDAFWIARGREVREYTMQSPHMLGSKLAFYGLPDRLYGLPLVVNDSQPSRQLGLVCGECIVAARVY